jgi:hypothetical protein
MISAGKRQLRINDTCLDTELFQEELDTVAPLDIVDEYDGLALDELEFEENVDEQKLVALVGMRVVLCQQRGGRRWFGEREDSLKFSAPNSRPILGNSLDSAVRDP